MERMSVADLPDTYPLESALGNTSRIIVEILNRHEDRLDAQEGALNKLLAAQGRKEPSNQAAASENFSHDYHAGILATFREIERFMEEEKKAFSSQRASGDALRELYTVIRHFLNSYYMRRKDT